MSSKCAAVLEVCCEHGECYRTVQGKTRELPWRSCCLNPGECWAPLRAVNARKRWARGCPPLGGPEYQAPPPGTCEGGSAGPRHLPAPPPAAGEVLARLPKPITAHGPALRGRGYKEAQKLGSQPIRERHVTPRTSEVVGICGTW